MHTRRAHRSPDRGLWSLSRRRARAGPPRRARSRSRRRRHRPTPPVALPNEKGSLQVRRDRRLRDGRAAAVSSWPSRSAKLHQQFKFDLVDHGRRQPVRRRSGRRTSSASSRSRTSRCSTPASSSTPRSATTTSREQRYYKLFNMDGKLYYSLQGAEGEVRFFVARQHLPGPGADRLAGEGARGLERERGRSRSSTTRSTPRAGATARTSKLREALEPLFIKHNVSVVFTGHDHFYERIKPQHGIAYFVVGVGRASCARGDIETGSAHRQGLRHRPAFMAGRDRRRQDVLPGDLAHGRGRRLRDHRAAQDGCAGRPRCRSAVAL